MHDVDLLGSHQSPEPGDIPDQPEGIELGLERQPRHGPDARLAGLVLEATTRDQSEEDLVPAGPEATDGVDDRVGTACPPAIGHQMEDDEPALVPHAAGLTGGVARPRSSP